MATRGQMIDLLAALFDVPLGAVDALDREISRAGLREATPRGRAKQHMTTLHIVHVALALTGRRMIRTAAEEVAEISRCPLSFGELTALTPGPDGHGPVWSRQGAILTPAWLTGGRDAVTEAMSGFPRDLIRVGHTLGETLASLVDALNADAGVERVNVSVFWPPVSAEIALMIGGRRYLLRFGPERSGLNGRRPGFQFEYPDGFLREIARVAHVHA
jgi:hypothetical protein